MVGTRDVRAITEIARTIAAETQQGGPFGGGDNIWLYRDAVRT
jgi:hypothetical protein